MWTRGNPCPNTFASTRAFETITQPSRQQRTCWGTCPYTLVLAPTRSRVPQHARVASAKEYSTLAVVPLDKSLNSTLPLRQMAELS